MRIILPRSIKKHPIIIGSLIRIEKCTVSNFTGSTLSQLLYFPMKSNVMTCPHTEVILKFTVSDLNCPTHSWTEQDPFNPRNNICKEKKGRKSGKRENNLNYISTFPSTTSSIAQYIGEGCCQRGFFSYHQSSFHFCYDIFFI